MEGFANWMETTFNCKADAWGSAQIWAIEPCPSAFGLPSIVSCVQHKDAHFQDIPKHPSMIQEEMEVVKALDWKAGQKSAISISVVVSQSQHMYCNCTTVWIGRARDCLNRIPLNLFEGALPLLRAVALLVFNSLQRAHRHKSLGRSTKIQRLCKRDRKSII